MSREAGQRAPRTLFVDDVDIASMQGVQRVIHPARKYEGNPVLVAERPWEDELLLGGTVLKENGLYRMWYEDHHVAVRTWLNRYAESEDGVHWTRPDLGLHEDFSGGLHNNIYLSRKALRSDHLGPVGTNQDHNQNVLYTPHMGKGRTYTMLSYDYGRSGYSEYDGYFLAFSEDGIHWNDGPQDPVIPGHADVGWFTYDRVHGVFRGMVKNFLNIRGYRRRSVFWTESADGYDWTLPRPAVVPDLQDEERAQGREGHHTQLYGMPIFRYDSILLGLLQIFQCTDGAGSSDGYLHSELTSSRDGSRWERVGDRSPFVERGEEGDWDWRVNTANALIVERDLVRTYYTGFNCRHGGHGAPPEGKKVKIGMATWPRDRFVGLRAGAAGGEVAVTLPGHGELHVNADAAGGSLVAEVVDEAGRPATALEAAECEPLRADSLDHVLRWRGNARMDAGRPGPMAVTIKMTDAEMFSLWTE